MGSPGKVWLVGAGPGDPGLMTLKGHRALAHADVVCFDRLVNPGILCWAKPGAVLLDVGKSPRGRRADQSNICRVLVATARKGQSVVRLKGGDPFVFGRGGEEAEALAKAGIPFEIIPGITAGIAVPGVEGIPVTHRGLSTELVLKIGARAEGSVSGRTLVGYMAMDGLRDFLQQAEESGFSPETPAALISKGTCLGQQTVISTLANLERDSHRCGARAPAVVILGGTVGLHQRIGRPNRGRLAGQRVILTVSESLSREWRKVFEGEGAEVWELPMTRIRNLPPRPSWIRKIRRTRWLVLTSGAAARALPGILGDFRVLSGIKIGVVGKSTATLLREIGLKADFIGPGPGAEALARAWPGKKAETVLHLTGSAEEGIFTKNLQRRGIFAERLKIYQNTQPPPPPRAVVKALQAEGANWVIFASGTAATRFRRVITSWIKEPHVAVLGPLTAQKARQAGWRVRLQSSAMNPRALLKGMLRRT